METDFEREVKSLINKYSLENDSNTPDFILSRYLCDCLDSFTKAVNRRKDWYSKGIVGRVKEWKLIKS